MTKRPRILIVEDDAELRWMFRQALVFEGFEVQQAGDGLDALRLLDISLPDAVVLDLGLPVISGLTVRQEIAAGAHSRHVPVIVVTGQEVDELAVDAACVLRKPVSPDRLIDTVKSCIAASGRTQIS